MSEEQDNAWESVAFILVAILAIPWSAYVLSVLWAWFIVPFGLPEIGMAHAYGVLLLVRMMGHFPHGEDKRDTWTKWTIVEVGEAVALEQDRDLAPA